MPIKEKIINLKQFINILACNEDKYIPELALEIIETLQEENEKLEEKLEIAKEAFSELKFHEIEDFQWKIVDKALNEIK